MAMSTGSAALKALRDLRHLPLQGLRFRIVYAKGQVRNKQASTAAMHEQQSCSPVPARLTVQACCLHVPVAACRCGYR